MEQRVSLESLIEIGELGASTQGHGINILVDDVFPESDVHACHCHKQWIVHLRAQAAWIVPVHFSLI